MKRNLLITGCLLGVLSLTSCKNEEKKNENSSIEKTEEKRTKEKENTESKPLAFESENQYETIRLYLDLKDALVRSNSYSAKKIAEIIILKNENSETGKLAKQIVENENKLEKQREAFFKLSEEMEEMITQHIKGGKLYKQYCPMAFNGEGAFWISDSDKILNPYFGEKMLKCGNVEKVLK
ncbi:DUF3347 domain-containing protein [Mesonia maritima]|uniref:DUF3347 domain-containing protein n=1 Tax=Mesonia maritima TaxID=1793873 RepID=A0ABU1K3R8_9FLAO|nr:DUF3347 domain-containing protein [Mesonia maritima]MDR6300260.1 hypothetical protein [Mesonia maritima]